jgi:hypothetical protein
VKIGFDLISDLNLSSEDDFNWEDKATSLYCVVAGNISSDMGVLLNTLKYLTNFYQGIFYVPGALEYTGSESIEKRTHEIANLCNKLDRVALLYHHVVLIDGIAIVGANGWHTDSVTEQVEINRYSDLVYLKNSIQKLQKHLDVKKILILTSAVPSNDLYFGETPKNLKGVPELVITLLADMESKVTHWGFGTYGKIVDTTLNGVNYFNNPYSSSSPYWAKRIDIEI